MPSSESTGVRFSPLASLLKAELAAGILGLWMFVASVLESTLVPIPIEVVLVRVHRRERS